MMEGVSVGHNKVGRHRVLKQDTLGRFRAIELDTVGRCIAIELNTVGVLCRKSRTETVDRFGKSFRDQVENFTTTPVSKMNLLKMCLYRILRGKKVNNISLRSTYILLQNAMN